MTGERPKTHRELTDDEFLDMYRIYIDYIRHENDLLNQRTTWFMTAQAALILVASYLLQKYLEVFGGFFKDKSFSDLNYELKNMVVLLVLFWAVVCLLGIVTAASASRSIKAAVKAQQCLEERWAEKFLVRADELGLPRLMGGGDREAGGKGGYFAEKLPPLLIGAWILFLVVVAIFVAHFRGSMF